MRAGSKQAAHHSRPAASQNRNYLAGRATPSWALTRISSAKRARISPLLPRQYPKRAGPGVADTSSHMTSRWSLIVLALAASLFAHPLQAQVRRSNADLDALGQRQSIL